MSIAAILANWKSIALGALALACAVLFGMWQWERAAYANYKTAQAKAVIAAQERADALANELVIQQAIVMAQTEKVVIEYRTQLRNAPDDVARLRAVSRGLWDLARPGGSPRPSGPTDAVPSPRAGQ